MRVSSLPTVYHFDIPVDDDANRAQQFYKNVFGWDMKKVESQVDPKVELWMCETEDENGKKGVTGGMMKRETLPGVTNYVLVNSIEEYISKISKWGGRVTLQRTEIPNVGFYAMFLDSENNLFGLFEKRK
jgi:predicted enzyme related to lactoylglutathione lyase